jgi:hypothetical protein
MVNNNYTNISLKIVDSRGRHVALYKHLNFELNTTLPISIAKLTPGLYFYSISTAKNRTLTSGKIVKL